MFAFPLAILFASASLASGSTAPTSSPALGAANDIANDVEQRWKSLSKVSLEDDGYRDKKRFCMDLSNYGKEGELTKKEAKKAAKRIDKLVRSNAAPGFAWRVHELRGRLLESVDPKMAAEAFVESLAAYPKESYSAPSKQSYFHHLAVHAMLACWSANGIDDAEQMLIHMAEFDDRFLAFNPTNLESRYVQTGNSQRLKRLNSSVVERMAKRIPKVTSELDEQSLLDARNVGGDDKKVYVVFGADRKVKGERGLVVVMPGGSGQAFDFQDWVGRLAAPLLDRYVFAVLSAPQWNPEQAEECVWVTEGAQRKYKADFPVEEFAREVAAELRSDASLKLNGAYLFAWSSGGPAAYATVLSKDDTFKGAYVLASVFKPNELNLKHAKGRRFWLEQGAKDMVTRLSFAQDAAETLEKHGAALNLVEFDGGHGFAMPDAFKSLEDALAWLSQPAE